MTLSHAPPAVVVDASASIEMLVGDATWVDRFRDWRRAGALLLVPAHFRSEVANALLLSVGLDAETIASRLRLLFSAGVEIADRGLLGTIDALDLASRHRLTVYDASYLALAMDVDGDLASRDHALTRAARAEGVTVIDWPVCRGRPCGSARRAGAEVRALEPGLPGCAATRPDAPLARCPVRTDALV